jgi:UDP:flavonoid glycosyltransferase YjiC (YdhE family)
MLFTTVPLAGHFYPLVPLAWAARSVGHEVLVGTSASFVPAVLRSGLPAAPTGPAIGVGDLALHGADVPDGAAKRYAHGTAFAGVAARNLAGVRSLVEAWQPDLVVSERAEFAGPLAAAAAGIPQVEFHWGVPPLPEYRAAAAARLRGELAELGRRSLPTPALVLDPWPASMRLPHAAGHRTVAGLPYSGDTEVPGWALAPRSVPRICVTIGTVVPRLGPDGGSGIVVPLLERLAGLGAELVVAVDDEIAAAWPALPAAVRHAGRLPLSHVLPAADLVVNHGGQGSTLTALHAGIPQLVLPQFDDQFDNADAVVRAGAGLRLLPDEATPDRVAALCAELLHAHRYRRAARALAAELRAAGSPADAATMLAALARPAAPTPLRRPAALRPAA